MGQCPVGHGLGDRTSHFWAGLGPCQVSDSPLGVRDGKDEFLRALPLPMTGTDHETGAGDVGRALGGKVCPLMWLIVYSVQVSRRLYCFL
jgi:hypothetical protein